MENVILNQTEFIYQDPGGKLALRERYHFMIGHIAKVPWLSQNIMQQKL